MGLWHKKIKLVANIIKELALNEAEYENEFT